MTSTQDDPSESGALRRPAGSAWRAAAFVADSGLLSILLLLLATVGSIVLGPSVVAETGATRLSTHEGTSRVLSLFTSLAGAAYFVASWHWFEATPGQKLLGLRVQSLGGASLSVGRSIVRWLSLGAPFWLGFVLLPGLAGLFAGFASAIWMLVLLLSTVRGAVGRGLHDRLAHSIVLREPRRSQRSPEST